MEAFSAILRNPSFEASPVEKRLLTLMIQFTDRARGLGYEISIGTPESWQHFRSLPDQKKIEIYSNFLAYYKVCAATLESGNLLTNTAATTWCLFKEMDWRPTSDLFDKIQDTDIVEVYGLDFCQIFRNMNFFKLCSYSLIEIFTYDWRDLYKRDDAITVKLAEMAGEVLSGRTETLPIGVDWHFLEEVFSEFKNRIYILHKFISPVFNKQNQITAFVAISEGRVTATLRGPVTGFKIKAVNFEQGEEIETEL